MVFKFKNAFKYFLYIQYLKLLQYYYTQFIKLLNVNDPEREHQVQNSFLKSFTSMDYKNCYLLTKEDLIF